MLSCAQFRVRWLTVLILSFALLHADETKDLQKHLQERFSKQVLIIRNFYGGDHLTFDSNGTLVRGDNTIGYNGCWCASQLQVNRVEVKPDKLILRGPRVVGVYDSKKKEFAKLSREGSNVQLDIEFGSAQIDEPTILSVLDKIFLTRADDLDSLIPDAWRADDFDPANEVVRLKEDPTAKEHLSLPKPIHTPDPGYTEGARMAKIAGDVLLLVVIDKQGKVARIRVERCTGGGLEEMAVQTVSKWTFAPATKNGEPVAIQVDVDVNFHLY